MDERAALKEMLDLVKAVSQSNRELRSALRKSALFNLVAGVCILAQAWLYWWGKP